MRLERTKELEQKLLGFEHNTLEIHELRETVDRLEASLKQVRREAQGAEELRDEAYRQRDKAVQNLDEVCTPCISK